MFSSGLKVVHDSMICCHYNVTELSWWQDLVENFFVVVDLQWESWWDNSAFVNSSIELNNDLSWSLIVNDFKIVDVSYFYLLARNKEVLNLGEYKNKGVVNLGKPLAEEQRPDVRNLMNEEVALTVFLHDSQESNDDLWAWSNHDLSFVSSLSVYNCVEDVSQYVH